VHEINGFTMGTTYSIKIIGESLNTSKVRSGIDSILYSINMDMSTYIDSSSISKFNNLDINKKDYISKDFYRVLITSSYFSKLTDGAFDITVNPLVELWGFSKKSLERLPTENEINQILKNIGMDNLIIGKDSWISKKNEVTIDLSAIAKGYAVDKISEYLINLNIENHMIEIGGEIRVSGLNIDNNKWQIGIQYPSFQRSLNKTAYSDINPHTVIKISDISIATSGDYRNYFDFNGRRYSHIISPKTGYPIENKIISVSVISKECLNADALATALMVMDIEDGLNLIEQLDGYESFFILEDNSSRYTSGIKNFLK
jgi:thiamine biosynthesis lipoprotein